MATITRLKRSDDQGTTLPPHASGAVAVPANPTATPPYAGLPPSAPRSGLIESKTPNATQATRGELCIGMYEEDPAIYFQDSVGQIKKIAIISHEEQAGQIEIATQVETDGGLDDFRAVTPLKLSNFAGTFRRPITFGQGLTSQGDVIVNGKFQGNVIATQNETDGKVGTPLGFPIDDKLITPLKLINFGGTFTGGNSNTVGFDTIVTFDDIGGTPSAGNSTLVNAAPDVTVKIINKLFSQNYDIEALPDLSTAP